ncbi:MAG: ribosome small subunit-dependent GTPase A [Clostridiales bacterium]|nr:ribosome small subunit-dependent GTPase A [Eubacteriales bacterium]MDH7566619.1 ribosome small subunit-dependent GTPase A [Clostridiales bacterium]
MPSGIILKGIGGFYYVKTSNAVYECRARGIFRKDDHSPLPGDRVGITVLDEDKKTGTIDEILPRESHLVRPAVANVNQLAVVLAVKSPSPDFMLVDKLLITARLKELDVVICVNKMDLDENGECKNIRAAYEQAGYPCIQLSSKFDIGFDILKHKLQGKITVFAGQSGVGKSTILNKIMNSWIMKTGDISGKIERGRHTTRHAELVELESGGYVVDTPGFSSLELTGIKSSELDTFYPEFNDRRLHCKFIGCSHISEPGCSVKEALEAGLIDRGRYLRYIEFYNALKQRREY